MELANQPEPGAATQPATSSSPDVDLTGQVLGDFRILHRIGKGGMGEVYLAEQIKLQRKVALKLLHPDMANNERALKRFKAEAKNVARASHANIVQIIDIYETNGLNYIALEYVEGKNLREFIERKGTPEISLGLHIMAQAASALQRAGELGVVHRDVKPENIMLTKKGEVKVADFGLSRCFEEGYAQNLTQSQVVMGTPLYMSPEQVEHKPVDGRTDIYSLGVTCYYMFAGQPPFRGNSPVDVAYHHVHTEPPPLAEIRPDLPPELCAMIHKMMAKRPEDRYQSAREIVRDISKLRDGLNLGAIAAISMSASFVADAARDPASKTRPPQPKTRTGRRIALVVCVLIALVGGVGLGVYQQRSSQKDLPLVEDPGPLKALFDSREEENELKKVVMEKIDVESRVGLELAIELSLKYLKRKKHEPADELFAELVKKEENVSYRKLGRLGHAMVLAFKDQTKESNKEFVDILTEFKKFEDRVGPANFFKAGPFGKKLGPGVEDEIEMYKLIWKVNPQMREMAAKALNHNFANLPQEFPADKLDAYRSPPRPVLKMP